MLEIHKNYIFDENQNPIAVQIPFAEFEKIEEILEAYFLAKRRDDGEGLEMVSKSEAFKTRQESSLNTQKPFKETQLYQVAGCLKYQGEPKTIEDFNEAIRLGIEELWNDRS